MRKGVIKMEFIKNELINDVLKNYYNTFSLTLDTSDFVPEKYNKRIKRFIFKNMRAKFKEVNVSYRMAKKLIKNMVTLEENNIKNATKEHETLPVSSEEKRL